jgi:hypothetical protein
MAGSAAGGIPVHADRFRQVALGFGQPSQAVSNLDKNVLIVNSIEMSPL